MADENQTGTISENPEMPAPAASVEPKKQRAPRRSKAALEAAASETTDVSKSPVVRKKRVMKNAASSAKTADLTADNVKKTRTPRVAKQAEPSPAFSALPLNDFSDILKLEEENKGLRKQLADKLRAENADLRKRLGN